MTTTRLPQQKLHITYANNHIELVGSIEENNINNTIVAKGTIERNNDVAMLGVLGHILDKGYSLKALQYNKPDGVIHIKANKKPPNKAIKIKECNSNVTMQQ